MVHRGDTLRILHTADWQLGLRLNFVGGESAARLRAARFDTVRHIGALAREHGVDAVVVAGDVFDDNGVGGDTLQQARDALEAFGDVPVVLLPGNHDPATADSALERLAPPRESVHVALARAPIALPGGTIYPCPLLSRHAWEDPAAWLPDRAGADGIAVALAHGGALDFGDTTESPNRIDVDAILARGYDYVALGDWHGLYRVNARAWYAGAPEATRFKEKQPGHVLLVEIDAPGAEPRVRELPVARTRWQAETRELLHDTDLDALEAWLHGLEEKSWTLLELTLTGQLSLAGHDRLETLLDDYADRLALLRADAEAVQVAPTDEDLDALRGEGYLGRAIEVLRGGDAREDTDALRLMYRLMNEERP
ncbi:MAG: metallophosphoesterase family protein [Pseudomonadota bacterium]